MPTNQECYRAARSRDPRFDGLFFSGVLTTGIYCRPICPAKTPLQKNVRFFPSAAAAEGAGFRACRRCRPSASPGTAAWNGTGAVVGRAVHLLSAEGFDDAGVEGLAARVGMGPRHLRRLFAEHLGASPLAIVMSRRLHLAHELVEHTGLTMTEVASASGFRSLRRFNDAFQRAFAEPPTAVRSRRRSPKPGDAPLELRLTYRAPFATSSLEAFLAARAIAGVEHCEGRRYRRSFRQGDVTGQVSVFWEDALAERGQRAPGAVRIGIHSRTLPVLFGFVQRVRRLLDLDAHAQEIQDTLQKEPRLRRLIKHTPGIRLPGSLDGFEVAVRAIVGQQITVVGAVRLLGRMCQAWGEPLPGASLEGAATQLFPTPSRLSELSANQLPMPRARAQCLIDVAKATARGQLDLQGGAAPAELRSQLDAIKGIGPWTREYICMRAGSDPDAFPAGDLVIRKFLADGGAPITEAAAQKMADRWRPFRSYAAMWIWDAASRQREAATRAKK